MPDFTFLAEKWVSDQAVTIHSYFTSLLKNILNPMLRNRKNLMGSMLWFGKTSEKSCLFLKV